MTADIDWDKLKELFNDGKCPMCREKFALIDGKNRCDNSNCKNSLKYWDRVKAFNESLGFKHEE